MAEQNEQNSQVTPDVATSVAADAVVEAADAAGTAGAAETARAADAAGAAEVAGAAPSAGAASAAGAAAERPEILSVRDLKCGYGRGKKYTEIVHGASFSVRQGEFVCVIGANGCGKTTTLKALMGLLPAHEGVVSVCGVDISGLSERERARHFAYIPQAHTPPFPFKVADVILLGRTPHINRLARVTDRDQLIALRAMQLLGIEHLADTAYTMLSGGQQQLVLIARALTQQSDILVMDEPTAALDFGNQQLVLSRMRTLSQMGKAVVMVTHDPDHALFCADRVVVMDRGAVIKDGTPEECITTEMLAHIYGTRACVVDVRVAADQSERVCIPLR